MNSKSNFFDMYSNKRKAFLETLARGVNHIEGNIFLSSKTSFLFASGNLQKISALSSYVQRRRIKQLMTVSEGKKRSYFILATKDSEIKYLGGNGKRIDA